MSLDAAPRLGALFGTGRSGTTWVGAVLDSHPDLEYRFEPFHRMKSDSKFREARELLTSGELDDAHLETVYQTLLAPHPQIVRPPFFRKTNSRSLGILPAFKLARAVPSLSSAFAATYAPVPGTLLIFKEVTFERAMHRILSQTQMKVVYLVRHPVGVCSSELRGQLAGKMPTGRQEVLTEFLRDHRPDLLEEYQARIPEMSLLEKNAVLWRNDVELGLRAAKLSDRCLVVIYEEVCKEPERFDEIFAHFGMSTHEATREFIGSLAKMHRTPTSGQDMFSVMKNPAETAIRWRSQVPAEDQSKVMSLVADSEAFSVGETAWANLC